MLGTTARRVALAVTAAVLPLSGLSAVAQADDVPGVDATVTTTESGVVTYEDPALDDADTTRVRGALQVAVVEPLSAGSGVPERHLTSVRTASGEVVPLDVELPEDVTGGTVVAQLVESPTLDSALSGEPEGRVAVESAEIRSAQVASASATSHRAYVAVVGNSGLGLPSDSQIEADVDEALGWWVTEAEGDISSFTRPVATRRYTSLRLDRCGLEDVEGLWTEASRQFPTVDFNRPGNHLVVSVAPGCGQRGGAGVGTLGSSLASGGAVTVVHDRAYVVPALIHEIGHNVGLDHANLKPCGSCAVQEYTNLYSVMGFAVDGFSAPALDTVYRAQLGIGSSSERPVVSLPSTQAKRTRSFTLLGRSGRGGVRGVEIRDPRSSSTYWLDLRDRTGRDAGAFYGTGRSFGDIDFEYRYPNGVTIERSRRGSSDRTTQLQTRKSGSVVTGARAGKQGFTAGGVSVAVRSVSGSSASVTVTLERKLTTAKPRVLGTRKVGRTLKVSRGTWTSGTSFSYRWYADGKAISKATRTSFKPTSKQRGKRISVKVTGKKTGWTTASRTSSRTGAIKR